ncbi:MAG: hypothetical protein JSV99_05390 [Planctomycetota bacterium]|nr:MAG: hypothetical protein JSV99_05390 [Planctomycetota bacterium]
MDSQRRLKTAFLMVVLVCALCSEAFGQPWYGSGTEGDPYQIWTAEDMNAIGANSDYWDAHFLLCADIDLAAYGTSFKGIGTFTGVFEGNGHTISNYTKTQGLFYTVTSGGKVQNLGLIDPDVNDTGGTGRGALVCGLSEGATVLGCYVEGGSVTGGSYTGGLVGRLVRAKITNCYSTASVSGDRGVGGLVGYNYFGTITGCHSSGQVQGGLLSGGLVGENGWSTVIDCYSTASVSGDRSVGGLVGGGGTVYYSYSAGQVQGGQKAGGLVGSDGLIYNCYSTASVSGTTYVGGLVGQGGNISNCYSTGSVSGGSYVGGLVGSGATVNSSFWDIETSGEPNSAGGTGLTTAEMHDMNTFLAAGWDFVGEYENGPSDDWGQGSGGGYMILWYQLAENELPPLPTFSGGAGTEGDPYLISNAAGLNSIGSNGRLMAAHFKLINDIDLAGIEFYLIGSPWYGYGGIFYGDGHTISNFSCDSNNTDHTGFFRKVEGPGAEIRDLGLINPNVDATGGGGALAGLFYGATISDCYVEGGSVASTGGYTAGLVGQNYGTISGCSYSGTVSGGSGLVGYNEGLITNSNSGGSVSGGGFGGLVGENRGTISNCRSTASLSVGINHIGGLVSKNYGTITDSYATGSPSGHWNIGGLVGINWSGSITNCYATGGASGSATSGNEAIGGLVGYLKGGSIANCYSTGSVSGPGKDIGGLVGHNLVAINSCYSVCEVSSTSHHIGGLVGYNQTPGSSIMNCYALGSVSGGSSAGGLVGRNDGTIYYSYSAGSVSGGTSVGGLVGQNQNIVLFSFWDNETSGQTTSGGGTGLPTTLMQQEITFTNATWDFLYTWDILEGISYPQLGWEVALSMDIDMDEVWMYQSLPGQGNSDLTASVSVTDDPWGNTTYSYEWEIILPGDVTLAPVTVAGGGAGDAYWTFASRGCDEPGGLSDSGQTFTVRVTVTGDDYGNTGQAEAEFGIALLGDTNNDGAVNVADRSITNAFWRTGAAGVYTLRDCDLNCDGVVNVADRSIANAIWRGILGQNSVSSPCPLR